MKKPLLLIIFICIIAILALGYVSNSGKPAAKDRANDDIAWQYKTADEVKEMIESGSDAIYLDIRIPEKYNAGHLPGALAVPAYPVNTPELEATLRAAEKDLTGDAPIIVICESGNNGAKRTISILVEDGIPAERLYILEKGANGWPHAEMLAMEKAQAEAKNTAAAVEKTKVYVSAEWVNSVVAGEQPQSAKSVILEVAWGEAGDEYKSAHIPGALHLNTDLIEEEKYWNIRTPQEIEQVMKDFGITKDTVVIVYGNDSAAARAAFVCLWAGVEEIHILDGGYKAWLAAGYPTEAGILKPTPAAAFGAAVPAHPEYVISLPQEVMEMQKDPNFRLVSIRSWEEFTGKISGYSYIERAGEPKGAVWGHDEGDYYRADGTIKPLEEIQSTLWDEWGISKDNTISFYCGTGWRASVPFFICYENGWRNISLYDGGWFVWQMDKDLPVQVGDPR